MSKSYIKLIASLASTVIFGLSYAFAFAEERCATPAATLQSANGVVVWQAPAQTDWHQATMGQGFCTGDSIRIDSERAALRLANNTLVRLKEKTLITLLPEDKSFWIELKEGAAHFLTRTPKQFTVKAPYLNAAVDGTEFVVTVNNVKNVVTVFEGQVSASNQYGKALLTDGMQAFCDDHTAPQISTKIRLQNSAEWVLYYPPLYIDTPAPKQISELLESQHYQQALNAFDDLQPKQASTLALQASVALAIGQSDNAKALLQQALALDSSNADAGALQTLITLVDGDADGALKQSQLQMNKHPQVLSVQLAYAYALQANGKIEDALKVVKQAYSVAPNNPYVVARYAELSLSNGDTQYAKKLLQQALKQHPKDSRLYTLAGFIELNHLASMRALDNFNKAIELNSNDSLSYLGQALALIQLGKLEQGRQQMELAVLLDPSSSLLRSYLGKTYFESKHDDWSATQYQLAKTLDPNDPTPWFYEAHLKLKQNRPVEALKLITTAIEKNDNRAVYRSRMLLDSDSAARSANQASIYQRLGFDDMAINTAALAVADNPTDFASHQALTQAYATDARAYQVRADEALLTKLYQPIGAKALNVGVGVAGIQILPWLSPSQIGLNEYSSLFSQRGINGDLSLFTGSQATQGYEVQAQLVGQNTSVDLGQYKYQTDGFRNNNDLSETISEIGAHYQVLENLKVFAQHTERKHESGDLTHAIETQDFDPTLVNIRNWDINEFGSLLKINPNNFVIFHTGETEATSNESSVFTDEDYLVTTDIEYEKEASEYELSYIYSSEQLTTQFGHKKTSVTSTGKVRVIDEFNILPTNTSDEYEYKKSYLRFTLPTAYSTSMIVGGAYVEQSKVSDFYTFFPIPVPTEISDGSSTRENNTEFQFGLLWKPLKFEKFSLGIMRWKSSAINNTDFGALEPSHILTMPVDRDGTFANRYNTGIKALYVSEATSWSLQYKETHAKAPFLDRSTVTSAVKFINRETRANVDLRVSDTTTISAFVANNKSYGDEVATLEFSTLTPKNIYQHLADFTTTTQFNRYWSLAFNLAYISQNEIYAEYSGEPRKNRLTLFNTELTFTLPRKMGELKLKGHNLFNKNVPLFQGQIQAVDDSANPTAPDLAFSRSLNLVYSVSI